MYRILLRTGFHSEVEDLGQSGNKDVQDNGPYFHFFTGTRWNLDSNFIMEMFCLLNEDSKRPFALQSSCISPKHLLIE
jgi:hypothetical protein